MLPNWKQKIKQRTDTLMASCKQGSIKHLLYVIVCGIAIYVVIIHIGTFVLWKPAQRFVSNKTGLSPIHWAAMSGDTEEVRKLAEKGANINDIAKNGDIPLHYAVMKGHTDTVEVLLYLGADINHQSQRGYTALHFAVSSGQPNIVSLLLSKGADTYRKDYRGRSPIELAHEMLSREVPWLFKGDMEELKEKIKLCEELLTKYIDTQRTESLSD